MDYFRGKQIHLKAIDEGYIDQGYLGWLSDFEVVRYLEVRWTKNDRESVRAYVKNVNLQATTHLYGIFSNDTDEYIGNIKLSYPEYIHRTGEIGLIIGNKKYWGAGCGTEAISLMTAFGFNVMGLRKISAGIYENNLASIRAFEKAGYRREYVSEKSFFFEGAYVNGIFMSKFQMESEGSGVV